MVHSLDTAAPATSRHLTSVCRRRELVGGLLLVCPACQAASVNLPSGWPHLPGVGTRVEVYCHYCDNIRVFDEGGTCQRCGKQDPLIGYFWGFRNERPTQAEIEALRAT